MVESVLKDLIKTPLEGVLKVISKEFKQVFKNRILEYEVSEYKRNYYSKTILHRVTPKSLDEFYQPLFIKQGDEYNQERISTASPKNLFRQWNYITIIGSAGSGKSTIVKYLFTQCIQSEYKIPIKVELRYLNENDGNLTHFIFNDIFNFNSLGFSENIITRLLESGDFVFFFDGFDEVNSSLKSKTLKNIDDFVNRFNNNSFLTTSRPYTNIELLPSFENFKVCRLNDDEISSFIKKQMSNSEGEIANKIIEAVHAPENLSYRSFLSNPLLLSMFILTFQTFSDIPPRRSDFYRQVFDTLFSVHDSMSKLAYSRERLSDLSKNQIIQILRLFSFISFFEEKYLFSPNYLNEKLNIIKSKKGNLIFDNENFIEDLQIAISILNKDGIDYTFPHRSLQEYFAASYIENLSESNKKKIYDKLLSAMVNDNTVLLNRDHFYKLLSEIDFIALTKYLTIPLLQNFHKKVRKFKRVSKKRSYKYNVVLHLVFSILLRRNQKLQPFKTVVSNNTPLVIYVGQEEFLSPPTKSRKLNQSIEFKLLRENIRDFRDNGENYIEKIKKEVQSLDKSDEEILDLI